MNKKYLSVLLTICCFLSVMASCQSSKTSDHTVTQSDPEVTTTPAETEESETNFVYKAVSNPVLDSGADPWIIEHNETYYYCYSSGNGVAVSSFKDLSQISAENGKVVYTAPEGTAYSAEYWAPELHYLRGEWYIYVAADDGNNFNHRMYVLKGTSQNPLDPFEMVGKISDSTNKWAIDGTIFEHNNSLYFIWSGWEGDTNVAQNIYIAHMSDPSTIDSPRVLLSSPTYAWEKDGMPHVNEGPTILKHEDDVFLIYSASGSWTDNYCLGMLTLTGDSPLNVGHWEKSERPIFSKRTGVAYGPGHCSFAPAADGSIWMIYHANRVSGSGWGGRSVWISPIRFAEDGKPHFGNPNVTVKLPVKNTANQ